MSKRFIQDLYAYGNATRMRSQTVLYKKKPENLLCMSEIISFKRDHNLLQNELYMDCCRTMIWTDLRSIYPFFNTDGIC